MTEAVFHEFDFAISFAGPDREVAPPYWHRNWSNMATSYSMTRLSRVAL